MAVEDTTTTTMLLTVLLELFVRILFEGPALRKNPRVPTTVAPTITTVRTVAKEPRWFVLEEPLVVPFTVTRSHGIVQSAIIHIHRGQRCE